jgi:manganese efflux pump family protein
VRLLEVVVIACGLAMDAFAVALGAGASGQIKGKRAAFRLSFHFGLFQFLMPVLGWLLAIRVQRYMESLDHWLAFAMLGFVGGRMIHAGMSPDREELHGDPSRGASLIALSVATSIDAFAVGLSLAFLGTDILWPSTAIGVITCAFSLTGVFLGRKLNEKVGKQMEIAGGLILIAIGVQIVVTHLAS